MSLQYMCYCHCFESSLHLSPDWPSPRWTMRPARSGSSRGTHSSSTSRRGWIYLLPSSSSATSVFFWRRFTTRWRDARETAAPSAVAVRKLRFVVLSLCQCIAASIALVMLSIFVSWAGDHLIKYGFVIQWCNLLADDFFYWMGWQNVRFNYHHQKRLNLRETNRNLLIPGSNQYFMWKSAVWENEWSAFRQTLTTVLVILRHLHYLITLTTDVKLLKYSKHHR